MRHRWFLHSYIWGALADSKGHKPVVLISAILSAIVSLAFAFSTNFALSIILRFFVGLLNGKALLFSYVSFSIILLGTSTLSKAIICKWSTDNNHALGMAVAITAFGAGLVIGPAVSGFLADPLNQYNITVTSKSYFLEQLWVDQYNKIRMMLK